MLIYEIIEIRAILKMTFFLPPILYFGFPTKETSYTNLLDFMNNILAMVFSWFKFSTKETFQMNLLDLTDDILAIIFSHLGTDATKLFATNKSRFLESNFGTLRAETTEIYKINACFNYSITKFDFPVTVTTFVYLILEELGKNLPLLILIASRKLTLIG